MRATSDSDGISNILFPTIVQALNNEVQLNFSYCIQIY